MSSFQHVCGSINSHVFTSQVVDAPAAADLIFNQGLSFPKTAEQLNKTKRRIHFAISSNCEKIQEYANKGIKEIRYDLAQKLYTRRVPVDVSFLPDGVENPSYVLNILSYIYFDIPTAGNIYTYEYICKKLPRMTRLIKSYIKGTGFVSLDRLLNDDSINSEQVLLLYLCLFSMYGKNPFTMYNGEAFVRESSNESLVRMLMMNSCLPVKFDDIHSLINNYIYISRKALATLLERTEGVYRITKSLYGIRQDLVYPDDLDDIRKRVRQILSKAPVLKAEVLFAKVQKKYPELTDIHELKSIMLTEKDIFIDLAKRRAFMVIPYSSDDGM